MCVRGGVIISLEISLATFSFTTENKNILASGVRLRSKLKIFSLISDVFFNRSSMSCAHVLAGVGQSFGSANLLAVG